MVYLTSKTKGLIISCSATECTCSTYDFVNNVISNFVCSFSKECDCYLLVRQIVSNQFKDNIIEHMNGTINFVKEIFCEDNKIINDLLQLTSMTNVNDLYFLTLALQQIPSLKIVSISSVFGMINNINLTKELLIRKDDLFLVFNATYFSSYSMSEVLLLKSEMFIDPMIFSHNYHDFDIEMYKSLERYKNMSDAKIIVNKVEKSEILHDLYGVVTYGFLFVINSFI